MKGLSEAAAVADITRLLVALRSAPVRPRGRAQGASERSGASANRSRLLSQAESPGIAIIDEPFPRDQANLQNTPVAVEFLLRDPVDERMAFEQRLPDRRKVVPLAHHFGA